MATKATGLSLVLSGKWLYALLIFLLAISVIGTFVYSFIPDFLGIPTAATALLALFAYVAHDLETSSSGSGVPSWVTYIVITVGGGLMAGAGYFAHNPTFTESALLAFTLVFLNFLAHSLSTESGGLPKNIEAWLTALIGGAITIVQFIQSNPAASAATIIVSAVIILSSVFHVTEENGTIVVTPGSATTSTTA